MNQIMCVKCLHSCWCAISSQLMLPLLLSLLSLTGALGAEKGTGSWGRAMWAVTGASVTLPHHTGSRAAVPSGFPGGWLFPSSLLHTFPSLGPRGFATVAEISRQDRFSGTGRRQAVQVISPWEPGGWSGWHTRQRRK